MALLILSLWGSPKAGVYSEQVWGAEGTGPEPTVDEGMDGGGGGVRAPELRRAKELRGTGWAALRPWGPGAHALPSSHPLTSPGKPSLIP